MEPQIQYAKTSDGVSIAYGMAGQGPNVVWAPPFPISHAQLTLSTFPEVWTDMFEGMRAVWYDTRGSGLSDRHALDFSIGAMVRDLEAVIDSAKLETFALAASFDSVPPAITYAARHSDRVTHLALFEGWSSWSDYTEGQALAVEQGVREKDWVLASEIIAGVLMGLEGSLARDMAAYMRECVEPEAWQAAQRAVEQFDVRDLLGAIAMPTLVVKTRNSRWLPVAAAQRLAAGIPNARLVLDEESFHFCAPVRLRAFLGVGDQMVGIRADKGTAIILFADIADSTALTERLGDAAFREKARKLDEALRRAITSNGGSATKESCSATACWPRSAQRGRRSPARWPATTRADTQVCPYTWASTRGT